MRSSAWICDYLVDRQHEALRRRIEIQPNHIAQLGGKGRILRQLEPPHPVRLQTMGGPDPLHRAQRDAGRRDHGPAGPVCALTGRFGKRQRDHVIDQRRRQRRQAGLSGLVVHQAGYTLVHEPLLPAPHTRL